MHARLAASILSMVLPLGIHAQTIAVAQDPDRSAGGAVVDATEAGQRHMERAQAIEAKRRRSEFVRQEQLERLEGQRQMDRRRRQVEEQRRQLLNLQAKTEAQRPAIQ